MSEAPEPRRRWFQYSLRTLLLVMLLASIGMSWFAAKLQPAREQREAAEAIEKLGGSVTYDWESDVSRSEPPGPAWVRNLLGENFFGNVVGVSLENTHVTDAAIEHVKGFSQLQDLDLMDTPVTDAGLEHLKALTQLRMLSLDETRVTDAGLEHLKGLTQLQNLDLAGTLVTNAGLEHLKRLTQLQWLRLDGTRVTDDGVKKLKQVLPTCTIKH